MATDPDILRVLTAIWVAAAAEARDVLADMREGYLDKGAQAPAHEIDLWRLRVDGWTAMVELCAREHGDRQEMEPLLAWLKAVRPD